ncbi:aminotransferase class III-fold pyridoxal phosphate-dependent enzyme [Streptomyces sp. NPDC048564]|uniref:aspartate aminotransferase family protein n=1 Tax=Streptomyces sp. NPDC048564 TaxID=3155760 RepID=UPI003432000C
MEIGTPIPSPRPAPHDDLDRLDRLILAAETAFMAHTGASQRLRATGAEVLSGGVASSWQATIPGTVWADHGAGSRLVDADGTEYVDLHGGFGVGLVGHAHPAIVEAVSSRVRRGTHFGQPVQDGIRVARALAERFGLPLWRFNNSGTESTMDAVHLLRVATGRPKIIKVEGTYHGHHDSVQVSVYPTPEQAGPAARPSSVPAAGAAVPEDLVRLTVVVPFGDVGAVERALHEHRGEIAGMIIEPVMMNIGLIAPPDGYLRAVSDLLHAHGAWLAFDEVKTGLAVAPGGATQLFGVTPDLLCLAKALGGGLPCGAIGGVPELMNLISDGTYEQVGTFNGNPLTMAAARAVLEDVLTAEAYEHFETLRSIMVEGVQSIQRRYNLPGQVRAYGAKGAVIFTDQLDNYRDFVAYADQWGHAHWLYQLNNGVFLPPWGKCEQWTVSVQHTAQDVLRFLTNLELLAADLRGATLGVAS